MPRRVLFQVHLWVGVIAGLYVFVVCVSGAALVFRIDIQRAMHPALFTPRTSGPLADPVAIMESVRHAYPAATLSGIDAPTTSRPTYLAYAVSGDRFRTLLLDPVSAERRRLAPLETSSWHGWRRCTSATSPATPSESSGWYSACRRQCCSSRASSCGGLASFARGGFVPQPATEAGRS